MTSFLPQRWVLGDAGQNVDFAETKEYSMASDLGMEQNVE
jgi:hypothetical protein